MPSAVSAATTMPSSASVAIASSPKSFNAFAEDSPEAYERLILDVLLGEPPLFPRQAEVELSWRIVDPFEEHWASLGTQPEPYAPGTWGPPSADALMARDGRSWRRP